MMSRGTDGRGQPVDLPIVEAGLTAEHLAQAKGSDDVDFRDSDDVVLRYYPQVIRFIKSVTGAKEVFPFDHNLRFADQVQIQY